MRAHVARPQGGGPHPGLLVFQEAYGVNAHIKDVAGRFARAGYGGIAPALLDRAPRAQAPVLFFWGGRDKHIPPPQRRAVVDALATAGKPFVNVVFSEADHAFFCDARPNFHASAAAQAWALTLAFLGVPLR